MKAASIVLGALVTALAHGVGFPYPTASDPCGTTSDYFRFIINTTAQQDLMSECTTINHTLWIGNNYPGDFFLPKLISVGGIYIGDAFYEQTTAGIDVGTLTSVSFPALEAASEILAVDLGSITSIDIPKLTNNAVSVTLTDLPGLKSFTFSSTFQGQYINITNTGLREINYQSSASLYQMRLVNNPKLSALTFSSDVNITTLKLNCNSAPLPTFSGPANVRSLEISFCDQPSGNWETALQGLGSASAQSIEFHDNTFTGLRLPNITTITNSLDIYDNSKLTDLSLPVLSTVANIKIHENSLLQYINSTAWPDLRNISLEARLSGEFINVDLPPSLQNAPVFQIYSSLSRFNCSNYAAYTSYTSSTSSPHISVSCTGGGSSYSPLNGGPDNNPVHSGPHLPGRIIAGITVSSVSLVTSIMVTIWLCLRRRNRRQRREAEMRALQAQVHSLAGPIHQLAKGVDHSTPSLGATGCNVPVPVVVSGASPQPALQVLPQAVQQTLQQEQQHVELEGRAIYEVVSPDAERDAAAELSSARSYPPDYKHIESPQVSREEALAARERAVEARERELAALAARRHDT